MTRRPGETKTVTLLADGPGNLDATTTFDVTGSNTVEKTVTLTTTGTLSNMVYKATPTFAWKLICGNATNSAGSSTHTIYVTFGTPDPAGDLTIKRIDWDVTTCSGQTTETGCVARIHDAIGGYSLGAGVPDLLWLIAGGAEAECHILSYFYMAATHLLGISGGSVVYVYPKPGKTSKETGSGFDFETREIADSTPPHSTNTTHNAISPIEKLNFVDYRGGWNNFEGCFKFTSGTVTKYYAGGAGVYNSAQNVLAGEGNDSGVCDYTIWLYLGTNGFEHCTEPGPAIVDDWP